ncbi:uncharacterized protein LOC116288986 [Actinia tenebrosa]|uniref:Uncharacterized protein LOC116288986 n=1 Tax=Actinia tenebrosa TaxID=6105 RepID=A0A6P8H5R7_ACTTE|nr:uncharacterized protein LOC116288986 [Actinia tenebrosa]
MSTEIFSSCIAYLIENCTGVVLIKQFEGTSMQSSELREALIDSQVYEHSNELEEFIRFDPSDTIFQEFDPPEHLESDPKGWRKSLPTLKKSLWECLKSVLLIQTVAGSLIGLLAVGFVFLNFVTVEWCNEDTPHWNRMPIKVQRLRVTAESIEGFFIQMWDFFCILLLFPLPLVNNLHLLTLNLLGSFIDITFKLFLQLYGIYRIHWMSFPLNVLFCLLIVINNYLLARHFCPHSFKNAVRIDFILSAQFLLGIPVALFLVYKLFPLYVGQVAQTKLILAGLCPLISAFPKVVCRFCAQSLKGIIHPGTAHVLVAVIYGASAVVFRVMQAELTSLGLFITLGIAHAVMDLLERITITMRDHIWEYLYRLVRRQRSRRPKYISPRSRRFIADVSIQIMMQEATAMITALGFINIYQFLYSDPKPFSNYHLIADFFIRAAIGLFIDLVFNVISLFIQTRVMNVAVNRVWKKKWRYHMLVNVLLISVSVLYFSGHMYEIVRSKYEKTGARVSPYSSNCSFPSFF